MTKAPESHRWQENSFFSLITCARQRFLSPEKHGSRLPCHSPECVEVKHSANFAFTEFYEVRISRVLGTSP